MNFWFSILVLMLLGVMILLIPLLRKPHVEQDSGEDLQSRLKQNTQIAREKRDQLNQQLKAGEIDKAAYDLAFTDLQSALALDLATADTKSESESESDNNKGLWLVPLLVVLIPVVSLYLYFTVGKYAVVENPQLAMVKSSTAKSTAAAMSFEEMQSAIKNKLKQNPDDANGWFALGRVSIVLENYEQAVDAFRRCQKLVGDEPGVLFALADALALQNDGILAGEAEILIQRGLSKDPLSANGLWLAGLAGEQRNDFAAAHKHWSTLLPLLADNPGSQQQISAALTTLEQSDPSLLIESSKPNPGNNQSNKAYSITLTVDISPELRARAKPQDIVFIYAKAIEGPPMPLAIRKLKLSDLPVTLDLSDADAMIPSMKLSAFDTVTLVARVSSSGNPVSQPGDFYTELKSAKNNSAKFSLLIDQVK